MAIFLKDGIGTLRFNNSFQRIINNGNISWNFGLFLDASFHENSDFKEFKERDIIDEDEIKRIYPKWECPESEFNIEYKDCQFLTGNGCGFSSSNFLDFIPKLYEDKDFTNKVFVDSFNYSKIYFAYSKKDGKEVCLKKIDMETMKKTYEKLQIKDYRRDLNNEINILSILSGNENSVEFYGNFEKENENIIIMEKCDLDLGEFIKKKGPLTIEEIKKNFLSINKIFKIMQEKFIIHRDLKLENFLVKYTNNEKTEYIIKLCDYGFSKYTKSNVGIYSGIKGNEQTICPEIALGKTEKYESIVDIFSLGVILYQLSHYPNHPFAQDYLRCYIKYQDHFEKDDLTIEFNDSIKNEDFKDLLRKMLRLNPVNRISWNDYFNHPFFNNN